MDDKINALDRLIDAVEAGEPMKWMCFSPALGSLDGDAVRYAAGAYSEHSLDAALALHEALLPGCGWKTQKLLCNDYYTAEVWGEYAYSEESGSASTPARAWLIAVLRAYRSVQA